MEPARDQVRYKIVLGKYAVKRVVKTPTGYAFALDLLQGITLTCQVPGHADVREGDLLTLYTEVLTNAQSGSTSVQ